MPEDQALYNANDGLTGRDGGPYLDEEEARLAESRRAIAENREPDYDNPPASAGIVLLTAGQLLANEGVNNLPSQDGSAGINAENAIRALAEDDSNLLVQRATLPAEGVPAEEVPVDTSIRSALASDGVSSGSDDDEEDPIELPASDDTSSLDNSGNFNPQTPTT